MDNNSLDLDASKLFSDTSIHAAVTLKADADCTVLCDGKEVCQLRKGLPHQIQVVAGTHLFTFIPSKNKKVSVERKVTCITNDNTILIVDELSQLAKSESFFTRLFGKLLTTGEKDNKKGDLYESYIDVSLGTLKPGILESQVQTDLPKIRKMANKSEAKYQYLLGRLYFEELGVVRNFREAEKWFKRAHANGFLHATCSLGVLYWKAPFGQCHDWRVAEPYYKKAAVQGLARAQRDLGLMYITSSRYKEEAIKWFKKAEDQGDKTATKALVIYFVDTRNKEELHTRGMVNVFISQSEYDNLVSGNLLGYLEL